MTRDDDPLLIAVGRTLKNVIAKADARIALLEQRVASLEAQLNLEHRVQALEAVQQRMVSHGLRAVGER